jgi:hypothetical protein
MVTLFDGGLLASFGGIFTFLFVYVIVFGLLSKIELFGKDTQGLNAIIALAAAVFTMFSPMAVNLISYMIPWLVILLVVGLMMWVFAAYIGVKPGTQKGQVGETIVIITMVIVLVIFLVGFARFYNPNQPSTQIVYTSETVTVTPQNQNNSEMIDTSNISESDNRPEWMKTLFSAKVLGLILILLIGGFAVRHMGEKMIEKK